MLRAQPELAGNAAPGADGGLVTGDLDATVVTAFSEKEQAAPTWKKTYGFARSRRLHYSVGMTLTEDRRQQLRYSYRASSAGTFHVDASKIPF